MKISGKQRFITESTIRIGKYIANNASGEPIEKKMACMVTELLEIMYESTSEKPPILKVKRSEAAKQFPMIQIAKEGDVGLDLPSTLENEYDVVINPGERFLVPTGIRVEIEEGYWASIEARSSTSKQLVIVPKGVIDEGYRGELFAQLLNVGNYPVIIHHGDRLIQLIIHKRHAKNLIVEEVDELSVSVRGESGFGSTGR